MQIRPFFITKKPEKGKLLESVGRKAIGLSSDIRIRLQSCQADTVPLRDVLHGQYNKEVL